MYILYCYLCCVYKVANVCVAHITRHISAAMCIYKILSVCVKELLCLTLDNLWVGAADMCYSAALY